MAPKFNQQPRMAAWTSRDMWAERVRSFDPSWYLICMGTGIMVQLLASSFPYPAQWLRIIGYIFWIVDIVLFGFFTLMAATQAIVYPKVAAAILDSFQSTSYLGAVPIAWETIGTGLVIFYSSHDPAVWVAQVFFWIAVVMTVLVTCGGVFVMYHRQGQTSLQDVTGAWLLIFIPMIVGAAYGSNLALAVSLKNETAVLMVSFLMLSLGIGISVMVLGIYIWRLMSYDLPPRAAIVTTLVPVGPPSMAAYAIANLSISLARFIQRSGFSFQQTFEPKVSQDSRTAIVEAIMWIGVLSALFLLGLATFFLIEAGAAIITRVPKSFNIGLWGFVFPCGVYANAWCRLSNLFRNDAMKGWGTAWVVITLLLWLMCAFLTTYKAVFQRKLFMAPSLRDWKHKDEEYEEKKSQGYGDDSRQYASASGSSNQAINGDIRSRQRETDNDGTYRIRDA